jgi:SAM-dependent methyltransferase
MAIDENQLNEFVGRFAGDLGAALHATTVVIGDRLGIYKALAEGPATPSELAGRTGIGERYLAEWLSAQAASGYAGYDSTTGRFSLDEVQAFTLADETSPVFLPGAMQIAVSVAKDVEHVEEAYRSGEGFAWGEHHHTLFDGTERFFRPGYVANLVSSWLPALDGVVERLERGATVADIGCGHGASTILLAESYPQSTFTGFDAHPGSIDTARKRAADAGVADRVHFEVATADAFSGVPGGYDLVCIFDALHDMGDPLAAAAHIRGSLAPTGTFLLVEPQAADTVEGNLNPVGRIFYSASSTICVPNAVAQGGVLALGAQAGEERLRAVLTEAGFTHFRRATETPFNLVLEARP